MAQRRHVRLRTIGGYGGGSLDPGSSATPPSNNVDPQDLRRLLAVVDATVLIVSTSPLLAVHRDSTTAAGALVLLLTPESKKNIALSNHDAALLKD